MIKFEGERNVWATCTIKLGKSKVLKKHISNHKCLVFDLLPKHWIETKCNGLVKVDHRIGIFFFFSHNITYLWIKD